MNSPATYAVKAPHQDLAIAPTGASGGFRPWRFRLGLFHVFLTWLLLVAGGSVTSNDAGLAVPDWPTSYGNWWFVPMVGNVFYEHGHRLVAQLVGLLTIIYAVWLWRTEARRWIRRLGTLLLVTVVIQGILGGITVYYFLPPAISVSHGCLAQLFFCLSICLAYFQSREWLEGRARTREGASRGLQRASVLVLVAVFLQLILGASIRHTNSALAIPDFPLALGQWLPPLGDPHVAVHFAHRVGALVVSATALILSAVVLRRFRREPRVLVPGMLMLLVVAGQVALGAWTVLSETAPRVATAHQAMGAAILGLAVFLALRAFWGGRTS